jgi:hypothetical protein
LSHTYVQFTRWPAPAGQTVTFEPAQLGRFAVGTVLARRIVAGRCARIHDLATRCASKAGTTQTLGRANAGQILTHAAVGTLNADTLVRTELTSGSGEV